MRNFIMEVINIMTDKEKLGKVLTFVTNMENRFYEPIESGKYETGSFGAMQCLFQATSFQKVRYFIEELMEENS